MSDEDTGADENELLALFLSHLKHKPPLCLTLSVFLFFVFVNLMLFFDNRNMHW